MYVKLPGGTRNPGGYIVPVDMVAPVMTEHGILAGAYVKFSSSDFAISWTQYVKADQLLNDDEVEDGT